MLAITAGEPSGIGPEILVRQASRSDRPPLLAVADPLLLKETAERLELELEITPWNPEDKPDTACLPCLAVPLAARAEPGRLNTANASYVLETLRQATKAVQAGPATALVTGPVHKGVINDAGFGFSGHTEFLRDLSSSDSVVMMLAAPGIRVALVTTHLPLREVADAITAERLKTVIEICHQSLRDSFSLARPRLQILGLNPHAGESGHLGYEDDQIIRPVIEQLLDEGMELAGPVPADTAFNPPRLERFDATIAMYHDQGLPVLKHAGFGKAVNITLGLPFVRTSVDHGTALDIAGSGVADDRSLGEAIDCAWSMTGT